MEFSVLGPLAVTAKDRPVIIRAKRLRAVLAVLLLHSPEIVSTDRIIDNVWPNDPPRSAVENIRTYIWQLRSLFERAGGDVRLESRAGGYRLPMEPEQLDLLRFSTLAADGRKALRSGNFADAAVMLENAMGLWRGDVLADLELGPALQVKALALDEQRHSVELDWISARHAMGDHAEMVATLRELSAARPLNEKLWHYLIVTLYSMGRTAEALASYAEARRHFVDELGIEPGPELQKVHVAILKGDEVPDVPAHGATTTPRGGPAIPRQLPAGDSDLVGRRQAIEDIRRLVGKIRDQGGERGVVTVSGPPGVGKSAMSIAAATAVLPEFPDGQLYVDLRGSSDTPLGPADVLTSVLDGFGLRPAALPESVDRLQALYRSLLAERRMLILLDDAVSTAQVAPLLPGQGQSLLLVTGRRRLAGIDASLRINLGPLDNGDSIRMLGRLAGHERVRREPAAALSIVEACGGLPLAIRIAGDRLAARPGYPLWMFAKRLCADDGGVVLDELDLDGMSMRDRLDASYHALDPQARRTFRMLGELTADSITAGGLGELLRLPSHAADRELERLVHEGLLIPRPTLDHGTPRYRMPNLLHAYARERLAQEEQIEAAGLHAA